MITHNIVMLKEAKKFEFSNDSLGLRAHMEDYEQREKQVSDMIRKSWNGK